MDEIRSALTEQRPIDLASIGTIDELCAIASGISDETYAADFLVCISEQAIAKPQLGRALLALVGGVTDTGAMAEMASQIVSGRPIPMEKDLHALLLGLATNRALHYGVRAQALKAALYLSQGNGILRRQLEVAVLSVEPTDDGHFLRNVAAIAGTLIDHTASDDFYPLLTALAEIPEASDEAAFQMGLSHLGAALRATDAPVVKDELQAASRWLQAALERSEQRADANLYAVCVNLLLDFHGSGGAPAADAEDQASNLTARIAEYLASEFNHDARPKDESWLGLGVVEAIAWTKLSFLLEDLMESLSDRLWLDVAAAVESELLVAWSASRSIFKRDAEGGIEAVVRPVIVSALRRDEYKRKVIDRWLERYPQSAFAESARELRRAVVGSINQSLLRQNPTSAATDPSEVAAEGTPGTESPEWAELRRALSAEMVEIDLAQAEPIVLGILEKLSGDLQSNADFKNNPRARAFFLLAVFYTLTFLRDRQDFQRKALPLTGYLWGEVENPHESYMQRDYLGHLRSLRIAAAASQEVHDKGGGRCDVEFSRQGIKFVNELKRSHGNSSLEDILAEHGLQTIAYQTTNVTLGMLMVLDLFDRGGALPHLREQVSVGFKKAPGTQTEYAIVVMRLQGNRKPPSSL